MQTKISEKGDFLDPAVKALIFYIYTYIQCTYIRRNKEFANISGYWQMFSTTTSNEHANKWTGPLPYTKEE